MKTLLALPFAVLTACASAPENTASTTQASTEAAPVPDLTGTWDFVLAKSDVATDNPEIVAQAAKEKIRFAKDASGAVKWTSFETDGKSEHVFLELPLELKNDGPGKVLAKSGDKSITIEIVDAKTIAMHDPKKGRLVYTKQ